MREDWFHELPPTHFIFHSQFDPRDDVTRWMRHCWYLRLHCLQGYQVSTNRLGPAVACPLLAAVHETRERPCAAVTKKNHPAELYLAFHRRDRELCANLGISFPAAFTTMSFHRFAGPVHLHSLKTFGVHLWQLWPRLAAVEKARLQERSSHPLSSCTAGCKRRRSAPRSHGTLPACDPLSTTPQNPLHHSACTLSPYACTIPRL